MMKWGLDFHSDVVVFRIDGGSIPMTPMSSIPYSIGSVPAIAIDDIWRFPILSRWGRNMSNHVCGGFL